MTKTTINFRSTVPVPDNLFLTRTRKNLRTRRKFLYFYICVKNDSAVPKTIPVHCRIGILKKMGIDFCNTAHKNGHIYATSKNEIKMSVVEKGQKTELFNGVHVYGNDVEIIKIKTLVSEFQKIWGNTSDIVNLPKKIG